MIKKITYNKQSYEIEIQFSALNYCFRVIGIGGFHLLPEECLTDMDKFKPLIIEAIKNNHDLKTIELWDGNI